MRLESPSFLCLTFLIQYVSSQSHTVVTLITTENLSGPVTDIFSIDFGGPTQTIHGELIQGAKTTTVSAIVAANTLDVEESLTSNGTTEDVTLHCSVDGNEGNCLEVIDIFNSVATIVTSATFTQTFPSGGFFGPLPTGGSSSSSRDTPAPAPASSLTPTPSSSSTPSSSPAVPSPSSSISSPAPIMSTVSPPPDTDAASSPVITPSSTFPTTITNSTTNSTSPTLSSSNSTDTQLPPDNSGSSLGSSPFLPVAVLIATCVLSIFAA